MASLAGAWSALVAGFGGMRDHEGTLAFAPRLPEGLTGLEFTVTHRGRRLTVATGGSSATYTVRDHGHSLDVVHHGKQVTVTQGEPITLAIPPLTVAPPAVRQPAGRAPRAWHDR
jgi:alpha,alpha-trehalose phosphorylase